MATQQDQTISNVNPSSLANSESKRFQAGEVSPNLKTSEKHSSEEALSASNEDETSDLEMEAGAESDLETDEGFADAEMEVDGAGFNAAKNTERNPRH